MQLVLLGGIIITICAANPGQYLADRTFLADAVGESAERMKTGRKNFLFHETQEVRLFMLGFNKKTQDASPQENTGGENKVFHFIKTHKKRCIAVVAAAAVLVAVIVPRKSAVRRQTLPTRRRSWDAATL